MARIKAKKKEICKKYILSHKNNKIPCKFHEIEKYIDFIVKVNSDVKSVKMHKYKNDKKCVWILFGKYGNEYDALQVGEVSLEYAEREILSDIVAMYADDTYSFKAMADIDELTIIDTEFYRNTYFVKEVKNKKVYAYRKMRDDYEELIIYQLKIDEYLGLENESRETDKISDELIQMSKSYYAESKLAYDTQALYWNPYYSGVGYEALKLIKNNGREK
ncbi:MAG: hypothetical protein NC489_27045 [Ruminococcus flavefaciens]|nr:hypothetical protein [Ruminococcus flavefaciens]